MFCYFLEISFLIKFCNLAVENFKLLVFKKKYSFKHNTYVWTGRFHIINFAIFQGLAIPLFLKMN